MELKLSDGDYYTDEFGELSEAVTEESAAAERIMLRLAARRGAFPLRPELGSRLYMLSRMKKSERSAAARQYVAEALRPEKNVSVVEVTVTETEPGVIRVSAELEISGASMTLSLNV